MAATYHEVDPEMEDIVCVQILAAREPLGAEGHPAAVELGGGEDDDPVVARGVVARELGEDVAGEGAGAEDGEELEGDDGGVGGAPAGVGEGVPGDGVS